jgi:4'-phosphopantetheinyl transferase
MPICYKTENDHFTLGLWEITENEDQLTVSFSKIAPVNEIIRASKFKYAGRKSEWIATRLLIYDLLKKVIEIDYNQNGRPMVHVKDCNLSISHTKGMVAVIIAKNLAGIDIELINERVLKIENKFMSETELNQQPVENKTANLFAYWSAKETIYKLSGIKGLDFKKNIYINPFILSDKGELNAETIVDNQKKSYNLNYFFYHQKEKNNCYLIVYYYN